MIQRMDFKFVEFIFNYLLSTNILYNTFLHNDSNLLGFFVIIIF